MRSIRFDPLAETDLIEIADYYDNLRDGLGREFLREFTGAMERIVRRPESYRLLERPFHFCGLRRFKYNVIYRLDPEQILVLMIVHQMRHPDTWKKRRNR
ncbi:MAG: type II toxin-antitoxin system RelE/ParE family toxin [bacterium]|nr:type II toxin-antitoxin system RelE/ParE family toxin [bacterium]